MDRDVVSLQPLPAAMVKTRVLPSPKKGRIQPKALVDSSPKKVETKKRRKTQPKAPADPSPEKAEKKEKPKIQPKAAANPSPEKVEEKEKAKIQPKAAADPPPEKAEKKEKEGEDPARSAWPFLSGEGGQGGDPATGGPARGRRRSGRSDFPPGACCQEEGRAALPRSQPKWLHGGLHAVRGMR